MKRFDAVFFDLDGTLTDPGEGITNSVAYALRKNGVTVPPREELYSFIGPPLRESFMKYFGFSPEQAMRAVSDYREYFAERGIFENEVYNGIPALLSDLQREGSAVILATSKPTVYAVRILERFGLASFFACTVGSELDGTRVNKGEVIAYAMKKSGFSDPSRIIMVGDRKHDVEGAQENGMAAIGVLYGYGSRGELEAAGACCLAQSAEELRTLLL